MSKPSLPKELDLPPALDKGSSSDVSASNAFEDFQNTWLSINPSEVPLFHFEAKASKNKTSDIWKYFTVITSLKKDAAIPKK